MILDNLYLVLAQGEVSAEPIGDPLEVLFHSNVLNFVLVIVFLVWLARKTQVFSAISVKRNTIIQRNKPQ